jgi:SAM-dependent methyltransferase
MVAVSLPPCQDLRHAPPGFPGEWLRSLGLDRPAVASLTRGPADLRAPAVPTREASLRDDTLAAAVRLFFCGATEPDTARLGAPEIAAALACGLLVAAEGGVRCPFHLGFAAGFYIFSDFLAGEAGAVMGAGETTAILYRASRPSRRAARALDLGCGAGTLALLLAADAGEVTGTDINPRAVAIARFNARANGIVNTEFRGGDAFAPVTGERFDLIVSQPPYYPDSYQGGGQAFLHGGPRGDEIARRVLDGLPACLTPGGRGVVFASWPADDRRAPAPGVRILQLQTGRTEIHGTRQSLDIVERCAGPGWSDRFAVPADYWDAVSGPRIDALLSCFELLRAEDRLLRAARLRWSPGVAVCAEGGQLFVRGDPLSLAGWSPVSGEDHGALERLHGAASVAAAGIPLPLVRAALRKGWFTVCPLSGT